MIGRLLMKAAVINEVGPVENILVSELPIPEIAANELLVNVICTTVNHVDCYIRSGLYPQTLPKPFILGRDFCGEVIQVGNDVKRFKEGDKVWSNCQGIHGRQGTFAEYLAVTEETAFPLPPNVKPQEAITVLHSGLTAILGLEREAQLTTDDVLYVHGAAGSIGAAVIQIAKSMGAYVIASTHGKEKTDYCNQLGADKVIDYNDDIATIIKTLAPQGVNVFWNTSRIHDFKITLPMLAKKGRYILMAGSGKEASLSVGELYTKDASIRGFAITNATSQEIHDVAPKINALLEQKILSGKIDKILALEQTKQAHALMESSEIWGKVIINL